MRSSDMNRFRQRLVAMKAQLREQLDAVYMENERHLANDGGVSADRDFEGYEQDVMVVNSERDLLDEVSTALRRIELGVYGKCEVCDAEIGKERLEALPYARHCTSCAQRRNW